MIQQWENYGLTMVNQTIVNHIRSMAQIWPWSTMNKITNVGTLWTVYDYRNTSITWLKIFKVKKTPWYNMTNHVQGKSQTWNNIASDSHVWLGSKGHGFGEQRWRSGESTRLPPMWPGFDSRTRRHMWVEFVVGSLLCSERFFSGYSGFPLSAKTNISKFQFDPECSSV